MNYELALKLKEAGFPQSNASYEGKDAWVNIDNVHCNNIISDAIYCPTPSELIEACITFKDELGNQGGFALIRDGSCWNAYTGYGSDDYLCSSRGSTLEEATARLWLELIKN
jgi:hypothetical protein